MRTSLIASLLVMVLCVTGIMAPKMEVKAADWNEIIDTSFQIPQKALVDQADVSPRGVYLLEGNSFINKISSTKIGVGGDTVAALKCKVSVTCIIERKVNGSWVNVTSYTATTASGFSAMISKSLTVSTGYYYRVRSSHYASTDVSSSCTNALWMGN